MKCFIVNEEAEADDRVALTPAISKKLIDIGHEIFVERRAWERAGFDDREYEEAGALVVDSDDLSRFDCILSINYIGDARVLSMKGGAISVAMQDPYRRPNSVRLLAERDITSFSLDLIQRSTRAQYMDVLSSQASLAGYKAAVEAAHLLGKAFPLMMTTAGTIRSAKVLVIGAGVAGLQAIATSKRLGAIVSAFDVRSSAKEQVESLGAKFVDVESNERSDGVYAAEMSSSYKSAQEAKLLSVIGEQDVVISTAQIPGKKAPIIINADMIDRMRNGSIVIDLASKSGGNCEITRHGKTIERNGVRVVSFENILNLIPFDASNLFAKNICTFMEALSKELASGVDVENIEDELMRSMLLTCHGRILIDHEMFR
jgi:NAD(P) transhydrogenase subunit alpha